MERTWNERTVGELAAADHRFAGVFHAYGIDFCCGGKKSVSAACEKAGVPVDRVVTDLEAVAESPRSIQGPDVKNWRPAFLAEYIVETHHHYVRTTAPVLAQYSEKVARVHGATHPETVEVHSVTMELLQELGSHMMKEEGILFPFVGELEQAAKQGEPVPTAPFGTARNPITMMEDEHEHAGNLLRRLRELTSGYTPPADACNSYRFLYGTLAEFEADLHQHIHLENNILFPKALELEAKLRG